MDFKLTKLKVIGSIFITLLFWIILAIFSSGVNSPNLFTNFLQFHNFVSIFSIGNIFLFIIELIIVYLIWSLIQKKTNK